MVVYRMKQHSCSQPSVWSSKIIDARPQPWRPIEPLPPCFWLEFFGFAVASGNFLYLAMEAMAHQNPCVTSCVIFNSYVTHLPEILEESSYFQPT